MARRKTAAETAEQEHSVPWPAPWDNNRLVGHEAAERKALDAVLSGRLAHAWLITGPQGIGKSTFAHRVARFLLAGETGGGLFGAPDSLAVDMELPAIRRMRIGSHPDFRRVQRSFDDRGRLRTEIVVDDVRDVGAFMHLTPAEGGWRVAIVDAADEMNRNAANALLKLLEEPPQRAILLLVAHSPGRLLPTIRSRCRQLPLHPLPTDQVSTLLDDYLPGVSAAQKRLAVGLAEGSIGRALDLAHVGSLDLFEELIGLIAPLPRLDVARLHAFGERMARRGEEARYQVLIFLLDWWLKRLIRGAATAEVPPALIQREEGLMQRLQGAASLDRWMEAWEKTRDLFARADAVNLDRKQVTLGAFFALQAAMTN